MLEKEIKILISKDEYELLENVFQWDDSFVQKNYYYRNMENPADNNDITIRARQKKGKIYLQVKLPVKEEKSLHIKKEFEKELDSIPEIIFGKQLWELTNILKEDASQIGRLLTLRKVYNYNDEIEICLDKNEYFDVVDYEIEIEYTGNYPKEVVDILEEKGIYAKNKTFGKYSRFCFEHQNRLENETIPDGACTYE